MKSSHKIISFAFWLSSLLSATSLWPQTNFSKAIIIDASGSMKGFFTTGQIYSLHDQIVQAGDHAGVIGDYYFAYALRSKQGGLESYTRPGRAWGQITLLDRAFEDVMAKHPRLNTLWLITDNIQDPEGAGDQEADASINKFYEKIRSDRISSGYFIPLEVPFRGPLYRRDGKTRLADEYHGKRALVVYALLFGPAFQREFKEIVSNFARAAGSEIFACKIKPDDVTLKEEFVAIPPEEARNRQVLVFANNELRPKSLEPFGEGEPIVSKFRLGFKSELANIKITKPDVDVKVLEEFKFEDHGENSSDFYAVTPPDIDWDPPQLEYDLYPANYDPSAEASANKVTVTIRFEKGVRFSRGLPALWSYLFKSSAGDFRGTVQISLLVKRDQFTIIQPVLDRYGISDPALYFEIPEERYQSKIYGLHRMFNQTYEDTERISKTFPIVFKVSYPRWPLFVLLLLATLLIGTVLLWIRNQPEYELSTEAAGSYYFKRVLKTDKPLDVGGYDHYDGGGVDYDNQHYGRASDGTEKDTFKLFPVLASRFVFLNTTAVAELRRMPLLGVLAIARSGYRVQKKKFVTLSDGGSSFEVTENTRQSPPVNSSSGPEYDFNSDFNYGGTNAPPPDSSRTSSTQLGRRSDSGKSQKKPQQKPESSGGDYPYDNY